MLVGFGVLLVVTSSSAKKIDENLQSESKAEKSTGSLTLSSLIRHKRGYGHGGGGGGGGGHQSYGHGPGNFSRFILMFLSMPQMKLEL